MNKEFNKSYIGLRKDILEHITKRNLNVLDVGCADGTNGRYLIDNNYASHIVGVEINEMMGNEAKKYYDEIIIGNLNDV